MLTELIIVNAASALPMSSQEAPFLRLTALNCNNSILLRASLEVLGGQCPGKQEESWKINTHAFSPLG